MKSQPFWDIMEREKPPFSTCWLGWPHLRAAQQIFAGKKVFFNIICCVKIQYYIEKVLGKWRSRKEEERCSKRLRLEKFAVEDLDESYFYQSYFRYDIRDSNQMEEIRKMTGICPQHDVLFDELTTMEHLQFFARIRVWLNGNFSLGMNDFHVGIYRGWKKKKLKKLPWTSSSKSA